MRKYMLLLFICFALRGFAQKGLDEMIAAEKAFAAYAVANGTKEAFLKFMDTSAIMFNNGEPYKAYESWVKKEKTSGVLNWRPILAEIANSGDFGWTAGPWTFQLQTVNDSVMASGYFFTVWKKNNAGAWKFIMDVGTDSADRMPDRAVIKITKNKTAGYAKDITATEKEYILQYEKDPAKAARLFRSGNVVLAGEKSSLFANDAVAYGKLHFVHKGGGEASSGDLGYTYGSVENGTKKETYLRIWRHEGDRWKIALEMVRL